MQYRRMPIEIESPEEMGYSTIKYNLAESSVRDITLEHIDIDFKKLARFHILKRIKTMHGTHF